MVAITGIALEEDKAASPSPLPSPMVLMSNPSSWMIEDTEQETPLAGTEGSSPRTAPPMKEVEEDATIAAKVDQTNKVERPENFIKLGSKVPFLVPRTPEEVTAAWLTTALQYRKIIPADLAVTDIKTKPIGDGAGVMGVIAILFITYNKEAPKGVPTSMVSKFSPQGKAPLPSFVIRNIFKAEAHFYGDYSVQGGGIPRPECYIALYDKARRIPTFCMLLENMMPAVSYDRVKSCTEMDKFRMAASAMARLHARWWNHKKEPPLEWALHPAKDFGGLVLNAFVRTTKVGMAALGRVYGDVYAPILAWMPTILHRHKYILQELFKPPLTLCHGDAHIENVFYDKRFSGGAAFIDFGNMMFSQAMNDVAFFMVHSLDVQTRRSVEWDVVAYYYEMLKANGVDGEAYTWERCKRDYRFNLWRALVSICAMGPSIDAAHRTGVGIFAEKPTEGDMQLRQMYDKLNERVVAAMVDNDWISLVADSSQSCGLCSCISFCY